MNSCLYECAVFHRRLAPKRHEFLYRVFYFLIDLDELPVLDRTLRLLRINRPGLYSFRESDHISHGAPSARENIVRYLRSRVVKHFYVSPFSDLDLEFDFRFHPPDAGLRILIDDYRGPDRELISTLTGERVPLTDKNLLRFSLKYPLLTMQVILGIHWHALLLWLKGLHARRKESQPELQRGVHRPHKSLANHPSSCAHSDQTNRLS